MGVPTPTNGRARMNILDLLIAVAVVAGLAGGYRRGFWLSLTQYAGTLGGIIAGVLLAPRVVDWLDATDAFSRQIAVILVIVIASSIGGSIGFWVGGPLRRWLLTRRVLGTLDSIAGAALAAVVTLAVTWLLALTFARGPSPEIAQVIQQSEIVRRIDALAPEPPPFVAKVQQTLTDTFLTPVFAGLEPSITAPERPSPDSAATEGVRAAVASTVKVAGAGCGGISSGSGFAISPDLIVTNAHVVAGTTRTTVSTSDGRPRPATVVVFDPQRDLAVLRAPDHGLTPLTIDDGGAGTPGAVIGYPGGGPLRVSPAIAQRRLTARGRDIYNDRIVQREIWIITAEVRPGNSGGPLVDEQGRLLGVLFAAAVSNPSQAYALTADEIAPGVQQAEQTQQSIDTRAFACPR
jgi:S1-C subfamily serine protease